MRREVQVIGAIKSNGATTEAVTTALAELTMLSPCLRWCIWDMWAVTAR